MALTLLAGALPAVAIGLVEDLTKRVHPATRLAVTFASGLAVCLVSGLHLGRIDVPLLDQLLLFAPVATLFTAFAIAGVTNAFNLIDGCHGLSGGTAMICMLSFAGIAFQVGDTQLVQLALLLAAAVGGFLVVNFPWGKLFLGDSGAYFTGFAVAWTAVLLVVRNPDVSPWAALLVCAYPVVEVLYSVTRRIASGARVDAPDRGHLHNVVATAIVQRRMRHMPLSLQNAAASVLVWPLPVACGALASLCYSTPLALYVLVSSTVVLYHSVYRRFAVS
jgi:UDP-N-acetylmuramyl pentapeptide phosphotransferase/UDP-N-acetylglucosamine-1-phosphate transferase